MKSTDFLTAEQDGVEFFTHQVTGESAVSVRGLASMCGVSPKQVRAYLGIDGAQKGASKLKSLEGIAVEVEAEFLKRGKKIHAISASAAIKVLRHCSKMGKPEADLTLDAIDAIGLESYIQGITGYLPTQYQQSTRDARHEITRLVREPNPWKRLYSSSVCEKIRSWYFPRDFFWKFAYSWMTADEIAFLNEHNPVIEGVWQRRDRIFQFLSEDTRDRLAPEIAALCTLVESSTGRQDFETRWRRVHGCSQSELFV